MSDRPTVLMHLPGHPVGPAWVRAARLHADVEVVRFLRGSRPGVATSADGVHEITTPRLRPGRLLWRAQAEIEARAILRLLDRLAADGVDVRLLHGHFVAGRRGMAIAARRRGLPFVITEHSTWFTGENPDQAPMTADRLRRMQRTYRDAAAVLPVSASLRDAMQRAGITRPLEVCPNPVDTSSFVAGGARHPHRLITVSRLAPVKRIELLVDAVATLRSRGLPVELEIVGDGASMEGLRRQVERLALDDVVTFTGRLDPSQVAERLAEAGLFVTCSKVENHPVAVIEAMSSGLTIVGPAIPSLVEMVPQPECGTLLDGELTADRLADAIESHLPGGENPVARDVIVRRASIEAVGDRLASIYDSAAA